jgi:Endosomal/lysosomal potassium channel TMEM175
MTRSLGNDRRTDGFRERGHQVTRLEAFVDAAFAFAVTLLVISIDGLPSSMDGLVGALKETPAFAASFTLLAFFWFAHNKWSRRYGLDDQGSVVLSLLLVFLVLVWVYPLRIMFGAAFGWLSVLTLPREWVIPFDFKLKSLGDLRAMFLIYAAAWSSLGIVVALLYRQAWRKRDMLELDLGEQVNTRVELARWLWVPVTGSLSAVVALSLPDDCPMWLVGAPGVAYASMGFTGIVESRARRRWEAKLCKT